MGYDLIITEKPSAAQKIATALADKTPKKVTDKGVSHYTLTHNGKDVIVACAVGHLYTVTETEKKGWTYPIFDIKWEASSKVSKDAGFTSKYLALLKKLGKNATDFTVATDFDIEGEVIGYNVLRYACKQKDAKRMKFSTLTKDELVKSYENASKHLIWGQVNAGVTRHELDWYYGINLSRALTLAVKKSTGGFKLLSIGRVQGPALKMIVEKEKEIKSFIPTPYWQIQLLGEKDKSIIDANHEKDKFLDEGEAKKSYENSKGQKALVDSLQKREFKQAPPTPFDLTSLQLEAHKTLGIAPKRTLEIAQGLYLEGIISYPRTSSQKLPASIGYKKIIESLAKNPNYRNETEILLKKSSLKPNEGKKTDDAHPAIYPTGQIKSIDGQDIRLYDLIVRRFLATFGDEATRETVTIKIDVNKEIYVAKGTRTVVPGWHILYGRHTMLKDEEMPKCEKGEEIKVNELNFLSKETSPPKRFTPASIIKDLEKRNLGTKSTRAQIVDNLYQRGYVNDKSIQATELGIKTVDILDKYSPSILDDNLTRHFEEEMESIRKEKMSKDDVLNEAKTMLTKILDDFKLKENDIGAELAAANKEVINDATILGQCQVCKEGDLAIRRGKFGMFVACNKYPDCKTTFKLPGGAKVAPAKKICEKCNYPIVIVTKPRSSPLEFCINPECETRAPTKEELDKEAKLEEIAKTKKCPKCSETLVLRKSFYGQFYGCPGYPKCKYLEKVL